MKKGLKVGLIWAALLALGFWWMRRQEPKPPVCPPELRHTPGVRLIYKLECGRCHQIKGLPGLDIGTLGPALTGIGSRAPSRDYLRQSLHDPGRIVVKGFLNVMPRYDSLPAAEEEELLDYLESLRN